LNYSDGWKYTTLDPKLINVVLDFANMPGDERDELVDYYLDHHGDFTPEQKEKYRDKPVKKLHTASAYEAVLIALGLPQDELKLNAIDMVDAAKYDQYKVSWQRLLNFDLSDIIEVAKDALSKKEGGKISLQGRLEFTAAFNQFLKRADTKTIISVIENCKDVSIYSIYNVMSRISPYHNIPKRGPKAGEITDFKTDAQERLAKMQKMTRGDYDEIEAQGGEMKKMKKSYSTYSEFYEDMENRFVITNNKEWYAGNSQFTNEISKAKIYPTEELAKDVLMNEIPFDVVKSKRLKVDKRKLSGYQMIGKLAFVPTGTWANALRARSIIEKDFQDGLISEEPDFILLQYGGTLQVCSYKPMSNIQNLPVLKDGTVVNDLGAYMIGLLDNFRTHLGYFKPKDILELIKNYISSDSELLLGEEIDDNNNITIYFTGQFTIEEEGVYYPDNKKFDLKKFSEFLSDNGLSSSNFKIGIDQYVDMISKDYKVNYIVIPKSSVGQDEITVSGGHGGIGSISNIFGECKVGKHSGSRFIDMFKNKIISDLSGVKFDIDLKWGEKSEGTSKEPDPDYKVIPTEKITKIDKYGNVYIPERIMTFESFNRK
jgi:hypothetical protein